MKRDAPGGPIMLDELSHAEMHTDHQQWIIEEALWENEARIWRDEIDASLAELQKLETVLCKERSSLDAYGETIRGLRQNRAWHESALSGCAPVGGDDGLIALARKHAQDANKHLRLRHAHERIKQHHHTVMAYWRLLFNALSSAT
ncbi:MAG TPA: hypothetical protein VG826_34135 [Pirellulales bacterium]|nr:hypothetical protein [Pirellulales bacterium]